MITVNCTIAIIGCYDTGFGIVTALLRTQNTKTILQSFVPVYTS
jgi:hypothetical protein